MSSHSFKDSNMSPYCFKDSNLSPCCVLYLLYFSVREKDSNLSPFLFCEALGLKFESFLYWIRDSNLSPWFVACYTIKYCKSCHVVNAACLFFEWLVQEFNTGSEILLTKLIIFELPWILKSNLHFNNFRTIFWILLTEFCF